ncbi:MAG: esterase family protein [Chloroflexota bacterium]|nr:esterase family protein [Chloroflexota bacterium]
MDGKRLVSLAIATAVAITLVGSRTNSTTTSTTIASATKIIASVGTALNLASDPTPSPGSLIGQVETRTFWSASLGRTMPYNIYLPPGYASGSREYPTVYLLHGMAGSDRQWKDLGIAQAADRLIGAGEIAPLIIVMPEGESGYWVDHATDGQKWGRYTAVDVVNDVDANFRSIARERSRAIGGLSMGAHGALQLALNYPGEFTAVGAHSLVLRQFGSAPSYFGTAADFAARDPMQIVERKGAAGCSFALWIDIGAGDPWASAATQFDGELTDLGIKHQWHLWTGDHSTAYWSAHLDDYLRFYNASLSSRVPRSSLS